MTANFPSYLRRPVTDELLDARYFKALDRFDIRFAATMWVYDNVRAGAEVLHVGCGSSLLALLKRKGVTLTGADTSSEAAHAARRNGYDFTFQTTLSALPFADQSFDYVVSFDVLSLGSNDEEKSLWWEMKRVLRTKGVTMHCLAGDEACRGIDEARFREWFPQVEIESRSSPFISAADLVDQAEASAGGLDPDFVEYVRGLSFKERRAFDLAMGYASAKVSEMDATLTPLSRHIFLKASAAPLGPFHNEHRDRRALFATNGAGQIDHGLCLDRNRNAVFDDGWFEPAWLPPAARRMGRRGRIRFHADEFERIDLDLTALVADLPEKPLGLELLLNGRRLAHFTLYKYGWLHLSMPGPPALNAKSMGEFELELRADRATAAPSDDRELSIAVCNIEVSGRKS